MHRLLFAIFAVPVFAVAAQAHFIWIAAESQTSARVVFAEDVDPDERVPITKIAQTKLYERGGKAALPMKQGKHAYYVPVPRGRVATIGGVCTYGVLAKGGSDPFLLAYYPKAIIGSGNGVFTQASKAWSKLPLDVVVERRGGKCDGVVLFHGKPADEAEVIIHSPGQKRIKTATRKDGTFTFFTPTQNGLIRIRARVVATKKGSYKGKSYQSAKHYATLTIPYSSGKGNENPAASKLLKDARLARATWKNFPGFTADFIVNHNGKLFNGSVAVGSDGAVEVNGFKPGALKSRVRRQLTSLVMHRISNAATRNTPCRFADDERDHPLGRKIQVLNDELHSSYRIRDRQVIEVNRRMRGIRFTITVLNNYKTPEKKFLPTSYVVNTWNSKTQALVSSTAHYNTWKRIGRYDLPTMVMIVTARGRQVTDGTAGSKRVEPSPLEALAIGFANHKLSK